MLTRRAFLPTPAIGALQAACSPLATFDAVAGRDAGGERAATGIAFGPHPRHRLDIYRPAGALAGARLPVVMFIYGGSWRMGERSEYGFVGSALAARGYVAVIPDYRLVPDVRFPAFLEDNALALRWVRENIAAHGGDPARIGVAGHSAGAYNAIMLALDPRYLARAGLSPGMLRGVVGIAGPYDFFPWTSVEAQDAFGSWPEPRQTQPVAFARAGAPPLLLLTGDADTTVRARNTEALAARMRAAGGNVAVKVYAGVGHIDILTGIARLTRARGEALDDMDAFFKARL